MRIGLETTLSNHRGDEPDGSVPLEEITGRLAPSRTVTRERALEGYGR
jgi:hypothetical protein